MAHRRGADRRVGRTRTRLHGALASLVHEKPYDEIVVKEILARADVVRSTFYAHYRDKDALLEGSIGALLDAGAPVTPDRSRHAADRILAFSTTFLAHAGRFRASGGAPLDAAPGATVHAHLARVLEQRIATALRAERRGRSGAPASVPIDLLARHVASTFVLVLEWWATHPSHSAHDADETFRALVLPAIIDALAD